MIGETLGPFRILELLGEGGMGAVYRAEDSRLGREVAIKVLPEGFTADPERLARFEREAQVIAALNHPNICTLHDVGHEGETHYLVMELVAGQSLQERMEAGLGTDESVRIATRIAEALEAAHAQGVVHRDLKPANVMLAADGTVKVLDFGLAKGIAEPQGSGSGPGLSQSPTVANQMTAAGMILGTAAYMSPEQARGEETDPRTDVWAWGVILHEMLTGRALFKEPTVSDTLAAVLRADLDWGALPGDTPRHVRTVIRRCLERDPRNRLHSIADARIQLNDPLPEDPHVPDDPGPARKRVPWIAAAVAVAGLAVGVAGWLSRPASGDPPLRISEVGRSERLTSAAISPDGRTVALVRGGQLYLRSLDSTEEAAVEGADDLSQTWSLFWSPDSRRVGYVTADAIFLVPADGGAQQRVCDIPDGAFGEGIVLGVTWSGPDTLVFSLDARGLWQVPTLGGEPELFLTPDREKDEAALHHPFLLPDGRTLGARVRWTDKPNDTITFVRDGERTDVTYPDWDLGEVRVTASGHLVFVRSYDSAGLWAVPFSLDDLRATGDPVRLLDGTFSGLSVSHDGTLVTVSALQGLPQIVTVDRDGSVLHTYPGLDYERDLAASPDGSKLAVWGIRVHDGQRVIEVTPNRGSGATWSPDGRELVYQGYEPRGLYRVAADGSRAPERLLDGVFETPHYSPDGRRVAYTVWNDEPADLTERQRALRQGSRTDIAVLDLQEGASPRMFRDSPANEMQARFSPDGRYLAYASDASERFEIYVTTFPQGDRRWQVSVDGGRHPRWSPNGDEVFFVAGGHLMVASFRGGDDVTVGAPSRAISRHDGPFMFAGFGQAVYDVLPDGSVATARTVARGENRALLVQSWPELLELAR